MYLYLLTNGNTTYLIAAISENECRWLSPVKSASSMSDYTSTIKVIGTTMPGMSSGVILSTT